MITNLHARFKIITAKIFNIPDLCDETPCSLVQIFFYFGAKVRPLSAVWRINAARKFLLTPRCADKGNKCYQNVGSLYQTPQRHIHIESPPLTTPITVFRL